MIRTIFAVAINVPLAIPIWLLYLLPFWALGLHSYHSRHGSCIVFRANADEPRTFPPWRLWRRLWRGWAGHCLPFAVVSKTPADGGHLGHELGHHEQWQALGPLFPVAYFLLLFRFGYRGHPLEVAADAWRDGRR